MSADEPRAPERDPVWKRTIDQLRLVKPRPAMGLLLLLIAAAFAYSLALDEEPKSGEAPPAPAEQPASATEERAVLAEAAADEEAPAETEVAESGAEPDEVVADEPSGGSWTGLALALMALATAVSVAVSFYLYRWRRVLLANPNTVVPEEWAGALTSMSRQVKSLLDAYNSSVGALSRGSSETRDKMSQLTETFMALQKALDQRDAEIARLKRGYDAHVFRRFLTRFIRVDQEIVDLLAEEPASESLGHLRDMLEDALDECGVEIFAPEPGEDYRKAIGVADSPKHEATTEVERDFEIAEVLSPGYRLGDDVIVQAKVRVYRTGS